MMRLPWLARIYVTLVVTAGVIAVATALPNLQFSRPVLFAMLLVLSVSSSALKVDMPTGLLPADSLNHAST